MSDQASGPDVLQTDGDARGFVADRCDAQAMERLELLCAELAEENAKQNLVSARSLDEVWLRHIADSAQLIDHVPRGTWGEGLSAPWLDLGSGAGFPGLVIAAMRPQCRVVLVESRSKRAEWLERMIGKLALPHCSVLGQRLEVIEPFEASVISARAFAPLKKLLSLSAPFSTSETVWVLPKGRRAAQELDELPRRRGKDMFHVELSRTSDDAGILVGAGQPQKKRKPARKSRKKQ